MCSARQRSRRPGSGPVPRDWAGTAFVAFCVSCGASRALAQRVWQGLTACGDTLAWRFALGQVAAPGVAVSHDVWLARIVHWATTAGAPARMVGAIETAVTRGTVTRADASALEECLLQVVSREGQWR